MENNRKSSDHSFLSDENGGTTIFSMLMLVVVLMIGGLSVDVMNAVQQRTHLQIAADSAAHAALYSREKMSADAARAKALEVVGANMPVDRYGDAIIAEDIVFGVWDAQTQSFTKDQDSRSAVQVRAYLRETSDNAVDTFLLRLAGIPSWNLVGNTVYTTYRPPCFREGFVAQETVDLRSNNAYVNGFCIHSNNSVSLNSNNLFEAGTIVSMPDLNDLDLPKSGMETNEGLAAALRYGKYHIRILDQLAQLIDDLDDPYSGKQPEYITSFAVNGIQSGKKVGIDDLVSGEVNRIYCSSTSGQVNIMSGTEIRDLVLLTNCKLKFEAGVSIENAVVATISPEARSINAPSGLRIGRDDNCAEGGGAQVLTLGGVDVASGLQMYGGQIVALGNVEFSANANGIQGASIVSGNTISGTSNMEMGFCATGMENNFHANYFRMVQ